MAITLTATVQAESYPPSVRLDVVNSGTPTFTSVAVLRYSDGTVNTVRTPDGTQLVLTGTTTRTASVVDYEVPYGAQVTYRLVNGTGDYVRAEDGSYVPISFYGRSLPAGTATYVRNPDGTYTAAGSWDQQLAISEQIVVPERQVWLVTPGRPELSMPVELRRGSFERRSRASTRGVLWPIGRPDPIVVSGEARRSAESSVILQTATASQAAQLDRILGGDRVLLLNVPADAGLGVAANYISVGDAEEVRVSDIGTDELRDWRLSFLVTTAPVSARGRVAPQQPGDGGGPGGGGPVGNRRWADLALEFSSWQQAADAYDTWSAASFGPEG